MSDPFRSFYQHNSPDLSAITDLPHRHFRILLPRGTFLKLQDRIRSEEGSPPLGPTRGTAGQGRFPGKQGVETAAGAPPRGGGTYRNGGMGASVPIIYLLT